MDYQDGGRHVIGVPKEGGDGCLREIALVVDKKDADQIVRSHNSGALDVAPILEDALEAIDEEKRLQASRGESVAAALGLTENQIRRALAALNGGAR
jgi:hypothetical protein